MLEIEDLLAPEYSQYKVLFAREINNSSRIAVDTWLQGVQRATLLTPVPPQPGDTNCDWLVNIDDLFNVIAAWGPDAPPPGPFSGSPDLDENGQVNIDDLFTVLGNWS